MQPIPSSSTINSECNPHHRLHEKMKKVGERITPFVNHVVFPLFVSLGCIYVVGLAALTPLAFLAVVVCAIFANELVKAIITCAYIFLSKDNESFGSLLEEVEENKQNTFKQYCVQEVRTLESDTSLHRPKGASGKALEPPEQSRNPLVFSTQKRFFSKEHPLFVATKLLIRTNRASSI